MPVSHDVGCVDIIICLWNEGSQGLCEWEGNEVYVEGRGVRVYAKRSMCGGGGRGGDKDGGDRAWR